MLINNILNDKVNSQSHQIRQIKAPSSKIDKTEIDKIITTEPESTEMVEAALRCLEVQNQAFLQKEGAELLIDFSKKKGKVTIDEYKEVKKNHPEIIELAKEKIRSQAIPSIKPREMAQIAIGLKNYFDEQYQNYRIISIGNSPAITTEIMQALGNDVVFLPISGLSTLDEEKYEQNKHVIDNNLNKIKEYLDSKGINQDTEENLILLDYTATGNSLNSVETILNKKCKVPQDKLHKESIVYALLEAIKSGKTEDITSEDFSNFWKDLEKSNTSKVSNVPHFEINKNFSSLPDTQSVHEYFESFKQEKARIYSLCAIDEAMRLKKEYSL